MVTWPMIQLVATELALDAVSAIINVLQMDNDDLGPSLATTASVVGFDVGQSSPLSPTGTLVLRTLCLYVFRWSRLRDDLCAVAQSVVTACVRLLDRLLCNDGSPRSLESSETRVLLEALQLARSLVPRQCADNLWRCLLCCVVCMDGYAEDIVHSLWQTLYRLYTAGWGATTPLAPTMVQQVVNLLTAWEPNCGIKWHTLRAVVFNSSLPGPWPLVQMVASGFHAHCALGGPAFAQRSAVALNRLVQACVAADDNNEEAEATAAQGSKFLCDLIVCTMDVAKAYPTNPDVVAALLEVCMLVGWLAGWLAGRWHGGGCMTTRLCVLCARACRPCKR